MPKKSLILPLVLCAAVIGYAQDVEVFPQLGHSGVVRSVAFSPDGKWVLSGSDDNTVKLWDVASGREIRTFSGHSTWVWSVVFSPDGKQALSGSSDKTMKLWDAASGREIRTFSGHTDSVISVAFNPDGKQVLSGAGSNDKTMKLWDVASGREIRTFSGHTDSVNSVVFSLDGKQALSSSNDKTMKLWDVASGREIRTFSGHTNDVNSVAFSPDGTQVLSGSDDKTMKLWDTASGREIRTFSVHTDSVISVAFSPDGKQVLSGAGSNDKTMKLWDVASGREIRTFLGHTSWIRSVAFSPDGKQILSGGLGDKKVILWDTASGKEIMTFGRFISRRNEFMSINAKGTEILSGSNNGKTVKLWDVTSGKEISTYTKDESWAHSATLSPDGKQIFCSSYPDNTIKLWDVVSGREIRTFSGKQEGYLSLAFSPDGKQVLSGSHDKTVKLWDVASGREIRTFLGHSSWVYSVAFSPDGKYVLSGSWDNTIKLWDIASGREIRTFIGHIKYIDSVAFSPDGKYVLSGSWDKTVKLWDIASGQEIRNFIGHKGTVTSVAFSPDGKQILSGSGHGDKTVKLWDAASGQEIRTFTGHNGYVASVTFIPNGNKMLSCSWDGTTRVWDLSTGKEIVQFVSFTNGEWVAITPEGYYNTSPNGDQHLNVRVGNNVYGIDQYRQSFYKPAMVALALSGNRNAYLAAVQQAGKTVQDASIAPPLVTISAPSSANSTRASISVSVDGGTQSIQYLTVKVNGKIIARDMGVTPAGTKGLAPIARLNALADGNANKKKTNFNLDVPLDPGDNTIEVLAFNGYSEGRAITTVSYVTSQRNLPNLYILSIGVSKYADNSIPSLKYAANDAKGIVQAFRAQEGKRYASVKSLVIADGGDKEPTSDNIRDGMDFLRGAGQNDVMLLFLSGHGGMDDQGSFFFMPTNMTFNNNGAPQRSRIIPNSELQDVLRFPGQKLVFIDSCFSGGLQGKQMGSVDNESLINSLKDDSPVVFTSSSKTERSWEHDPARLGLFTHVLLEGLSGKADADKNGKITIQELGDYVKRTVPGMKDSQHPYYLTPPGYRDFVVAELK